jgi:hypothetical protein
LSYPREPRCLGHIDGLLGDPLGNLGAEVGPMIGRLYRTHGIRNDPVPQSRCLLLWVRGELGGKLLCL